MFSTLLAILKSWFGWPDLKDIGADIAKPIQEQLRRIERRIKIAIVLTNLFMLLGFAVIMGCLESGFHWKYLLQL